MPSRRVVVAAVAAPLVAGALLAASARLARSDRPGEARPWLGVGLAAGTHGAKITQVFEGSPAAGAGIHAGDEVTAVDATPTPTPEALSAAVHAAGVGTRVKVRVLGPDGVARELNIRLDVMPSEQELVRGALEGKPAPDFALADAHGPAAPVSLAGLRGDVVVLDFWATWCGFCVASLPSVEAWHERYAAQGLRVVGVTDEKLGEAEPFARAHGVTYTIASDAAHAVIDRYHVAALPMMVLIDRRGVVRRVGLGAGGDELADTQAAIEKLLAAKP